MNWTLVTSFRVYGIPKGQPRARHTKNGHIYTPNSADDFRSAVQVAALRAGLGTRDLSGVLRVDERFFFPCPRRLKHAVEQGPVPHGSKPDRDNCDKLVLDSLTQIGAWRDDAQVAAGVIEKWFSSPAEQPGAEISIYEWEA